MPCPTVPCPAHSVLFQLVVAGPASSVQLRNLTSSSEYLVSVLPVYKDGVGKGLQGLVTTGRWGAGGPFSPCGAWHQHGGAVGKSGSEASLGASVPGPLYPAVLSCTQECPSFHCHTSASPCPCSHLLRVPTLPGHSTWLRSLIISSSPPPKDCQECPLTVLLMEEPHATNVPSESGQCRGCQ